MMEMEALNHKESLSYYGILGVLKDSSVEEIKRAYRKLAMVSMIVSFFLLVLFCFFNWGCKLVLIQAFGGFFVRWV
jgi:hypothetical protein